MIGLGAMGGDIRPGKNVLSSSLGVEQCSGDGDYRESSATNTGSLLGSKSSSHATVSGGTITN